MMSDSVRLERQGQVATILLNRPDEGNAIDIALADGLLSAALECDADAAIRCVILTAAGKMFCAGGDVKGFAAAQDDLPRLVKRLTAPLHAAIARLARMEKPLVTAVNGAAAGAGFGLAIMGDVTLAARSAKFAVAYGAIGLSPDAGTTWLLPRLVGLQQAKRIALLGDRIDAAQAEHIGLITRMVDDGDLMAEARQVADRLATMSMPALRRTRDLLHDSLSTGLETQMEREAQAIARCAGGADGREGINAFIEKRKPTFSSLGSG